MLDETKDGRKTKTNKNTGKNRQDTINKIVKSRIGIIPGHISPFAIEQITNGKKEQTLIYEIPIFNKKTFASLGYIYVTVEDLV